MASKRKQSALRRFVSLVRGGAIGKSKYVSRGKKPQYMLGTLGTESLQAAAGQAPYTATNIAVTRELQKRSKTPGKYR